MDKNLRQLIEQLTMVIEGLEAQLGDVPAALEKVRSEGFEAGKIEGDAAGYARGFEEGKASVVCEQDPEKMYTQADLDAAVEAVRAALTTEMESLRLQVGDLQVQLEQAKADMEGKIQTAVKEAIQVFKAELKVKFAEQQAKESSDEAEFGKLLEEVVIPEPVPEPTPAPTPEA